MCQRKNILILTGQNHKSFRICSVERRIASNVAERLEHSVKEHIKFHAFYSAYPC